ncbi:MAG: efflux RND transporter permease subunit [Firmicutes bacterium]|nr:efflux RND transporter permease subunit [Bacillota bacterium]
MHIAEWSVRRPVAVSVTVLVVVLLGLVSFLNLPLDLFPQVDLPMAGVITGYAGAGPEEVESLVTVPLERTLATAPGIKNITSTSRRGQSNITVEFNWGTNMDAAMQDLRERLDLARRSLPDDADTPMLVKYDPSMMPVLVVTLAGAVGGEELKRLADDVVRPRLERVDGVASVSVWGGLTREIQVLVDPARLRGYGITLAQVEAALRTENQDVPGGEVREGTRRYTVRVPGEFHDLKDLQSVVVNGSDGTAVRLADLAEIRDGHAEVTQLARLNGQPSVLLSVQKQSGANTVEVVRRVKDALGQLGGELPGNIRYLPVLDQSTIIEASIRDLTRNLLAGSLLAVAVIYFFLRNWRATVVISLSIPVAVIAAFCMLYFGGQTLNMISLGGLTLGVGMMVDDSIVVLENIYRHRQEGLAPFAAAVSGAKEVTGAVIASTLTTVAVFLPVVFVKGMTAQFFTPMALAVSFALLASLYAALTLVPMVSARVLERERGEARPALGRLAAVMERTGAWLDALYARYRTLLAWALGHRRLVVLGAAGLFAASLAAVPLVGTEFMPALDRGLVNITVEMPAGTDLDVTNRVVTEIEAAVASLPEVDAVIASVGGGGMGMGGGGGTDQASVRLQLKERSERKRSAAQVAEDLRRSLPRFPGVNVWVDAPASIFGGRALGGTSAPFELALKGDELDVLKGLADRLVGLVRETPGTRQVRSSWEQARPEAHVLVDRDRAAAYGLSVGQVASAVRAAVQGDVVTRYRVGGDEIDVRVRFPEEARRDVASLKTIPLLSGRGTEVLLQDVAEVRPGTGPMTIQRRNQTRVISITSQLVGRSLGDVVAEVRQKVAQVAMPPGYWVEYTGEAEQMRETFGTLLVSLALAVVLIYLVLAAQFESFFFPFIVMFSVPVALTGIVGGLLLTGRAFSVPAFVGAILTVGIVTKNAIVLVDYVNQLRARGMSRDEALLRAGPVRLRPILMTTGTTVMAMLPLVLGIGEGAETQAPLATAVVGGLLFSTLVTLVLVPVVYSIFDDLVVRVRERWRRSPP